MEQKQIAKVKPFTFNDDLTLLEITTSIFHKLYKKMFQVKELLWDHDQEVIIDIGSVYTNLEEWKKFTDEHSDNGYTVADLDNWFGIDIVEENWVRKEPNSTKEKWCSLNQIEDVRVCSNNESRHKQYYEYQYEIKNNE